jgi:putative transposase
VEDERLLGVIRTTHKNNFEAYGYRRMCQAPGRERSALSGAAADGSGRDLGREAGREAVVDDEGRSERLEARDLVCRNFTASAPNQLWVCDFTHVRCWEGVLYSSFVIDVFSRMVVGWQLAANMRTTLVLDALRMALGLSGTRSRRRARSPQ